MADNSNEVRLRQLKTPIKLIKGIVTDTAPVNQPEGTYRYALNMIVESESGEIGSFINEEGNEQYVSLPDISLRIVGAVLINNNDIIVFSTNFSGTHNEIGIISDREEYTTIIKSTCLGFSWLHPVKALYRILNGCERMIYFTDNYNKFRVINLDNLIQYTNIDSNTNLPFNSEDANILDEWDCNRFNYSRDMVIPVLDVLPAEDGGELKTGTYAFSVRYLDDDFNATDWLYTTETTIIADVIESTRPSLALGHADGGIFDLTANSITNSTKSIPINIANLDPTYPYVQLAVVQWVRGNDYEQEVYVIDEILPINRQNTVTYTYTGNPNVLLQSTIDELSINNVKINTVKTIGQLDNRLYLANTTDQQVNWAEFQRKASKIVINPVWTQNVKVPARGSSSHFYYFNERSYMRDEIYAFGIVYVFKDGTESPVFHIPGRPRNQGAYSDENGNLTFLDVNQMRQLGNDNTDGTFNRGFNSEAFRNVVPIDENWDDQILTEVLWNYTGAPVVIGDTEIEERNTRHIPLSEKVSPNQIERWKVYNTGISLPASNDFQEFRQGIFSYYEGDQIYLPLNDCSGTDIWGEDAWGNPLVNTPIRHHKFPSGDITKPFDAGENGFIYPIGIQVSNIDYPQTEQEIQGYYIVRMERNSFEETVVDKGYTGRVFRTTFGNDQYSVVAYNLTTGEAGGQDGTEVAIVSFTSPKVHLTNELKKIDYHCIDTVVSVTTPPLNQPFRFNQQTSAFHPEELAVKNRIQLGFIYMNPPGGVPAQPLSSADFAYGYVVQPVVSPFPRPIISNLFNRNTYVSGCADFFPTPTVSNNLALRYGAVKMWRKPYSVLYNKQYIKASNFLQTETGSGKCSVLYGGDTFISELTFRSIFLRDHAPWLNADFRFVHTGFYCESTINSELRSHGIMNWEKHLRYAEKTLTSLEDFLELDEFPDNTDYNYSLDYVRYHKQYSVKSNVSNYFSLPINFDYCLECQNKFPTRIWYSEKSNLEQRSDKYRTILGNYYQDLPSDFGEVTGLFVTRNSLYANLERASYVIPTQPQELNTNAGTVFVGTGEVFGAPPQMLETAERGYAGSQSQFSTVVTEFGALFVDADSGKIFKLTDKLEDLTALGIRNWMQRNAGFKIDRQVKEFRNFSHVHPCGVGFHVGFDPRHNRVLITKKDYGFYDDFTDPIQSTLEYEEGVNIGFNISKQTFYTWPQGSTLVELKCDDTDFFEDLSWTISIDLSTNRWLSYHSYRPYIYMNNRNWFYTADERTELVTPSIVWKHGTLNYGEFYNVTRQSIIDFVFNQNQMQTKTSEAIMYLSEVIDPNTGVEQYYDTFNEACLYNSWQTTGLMQVKPKNSDDPFGNVFNQIGNIYADFNERRWSINEYADYVINRNEPLFTSSYLNFSYRLRRDVDGVLRIPNETAYDFNKSPFEVEPLRDTWLGVWLAYNNTYGHKMVTEILISNNNISFK